MGLFVREDGHFQGWLAAFLCCCAAVADDESPFEKARSHSTNQVELCNEQPLPLANLPLIPSRRSNTFVKGDEPVDPFYLPHSRPARKTERPPSLKPFDFGDGPLVSRWSYHAKPKSPSGHGSRPSISTPYNFRRLDHSDAQIQSLVPLRLGPVILRESPVPDADIPTPERGRLKSPSDSTQHLLGESATADSYLLNRETPFQRCQQRSSGFWPLPPQPAHMEDEEVTHATAERRTGRPSLRSRSRSSGSLQRHGTETSSSSIASRPSSERLRPKRKRSMQSLRRTWLDDEDEIEKEVVELNTIVEERRAETGRENTSEDHIAAVAPSMQIRARSETLDAIGSALSRPVTSRNEHCPSGSVDNSPEWFVRRSISSNTRVTTRVSGWLSGMFPSASTPQLPGGEPFYRCQPPPRPTQRSYSESSIITSLTDIDSPSLTAASSPTTRGHSRSHTGESRMTPMTPAAMFTSHGDFDERKYTYDHWPIAITPNNQVGVAL